jgi:WD40 repeat protein
MITGSDDLQLWDLESGKELDVIKSIDARDAGFSLDGNTIVTLSADGTVRFWSFASSGQSLVDLAKRSVSRCLTIEQNKRAYLEPSPPDWCIEMAKWPYATPEWKVWLADTRAKKSVPLPTEK